MPERSTCGVHVLEFDPDKHLYTLDKQPVFGVTTAGKHGYPASKQITNWQTKHSARYAMSAVIPLVQKKKRVTKKMMEEIAEASLDAYAKPLGAAADIGTIVHDYAYHTESGLHYDMEQWAEHPDIKKVRAGIRAWNTWKARNKDEVVSLEALVGSYTRMYAGRLDRLSRRGEQVVLGDYKTSSGFYVSQFVQAAGYRRAVREWLGLEVTLLEIIRLDKYRGRVETRTSQELAHVFKIDHAELLEVLDRQFIRNLETAKFRQVFEVI
jgi:ATP-dependent exoDNAse (exonuclease V) beta subunit